MTFEVAIYIERLWSQSWLSQRITILRILTCGDDDKLFSKVWKTSNCFKINTKITFN